MIPSFSPLARCLSGGLLVTALVTACKTSAPTVQQTQTPAQPVILTLGNKSFSTDDFFQAFTKNQLSDDSTQRTDVKEYLDLYTNLKLKVLAAEQEGRDTSEAFREEMNTYRKQLAQTYLTDKVLVEQLAAEAYQRMQEEVSASHILLPVAEDANPADTLAVYKNAQTLRQRLLGGEDFTSVAKQVSKDPTVEQNGGNLGYFTAFATVYPFETAAYTTPVGSISQPVRTRFGYHLIKVNDRRPSRGKIRVAHILVRVSPGAPEVGQQVAKNKIDDAYMRLQRGDAFEAVCRDVSDDVTSKNNGGVLPVFETGRNVPTFEEAAFSLSKPGDVSKPVRTNYGWHIIKLIEKKPLEPYTELAPGLRQRVMTDTRADVLRQATLQRLQKEYAVKENKAVLDNTLNLADSTLIRGLWRFTEPLAPALEKKTLVTVADKPYTVNEFLSYVRQREQPIQANPAGPQPVPTVAMKRLYNRFVGDQLLGIEEANLEKKYPEFRGLLNEIRDGVLLSQMMEKNVWERSLADSVGQRRYYEENKAKYNYPKRAFATVIVAQNEATLKQVKETLASKPYNLRRSAPTLQFGRNQTQLTPKLSENLFDVLVVMAKNPEYLIEVSGSQLANEADTVSAKRVRNTVDYLVKNGISLARIMEKDHGVFRPGPKDEVNQQKVTFQYFSNAKADVAKVLNAKEPNAVLIEEGAFAEGENQYVDGVDWTPGTMFLNPGTKSVQVTITKVEPPRPKTFAEARGSVINDYQAQLEKQWLTQLREKYPVKINDLEMKKLIK